MLSGFGVGIVFNPLYQGLQKRWWQIWPLPPPVFFTMGHSHTPSLIVGSCMVRQCEAFYRKRVFMFCSVACLFPSPFSCFLQQNPLPSPAPPPPPPALPPPRLFLFWCLAVFSCWSSRVFVLFVALPPPPGVVSFESGLHLVSWKL